MGMTAAVSVSTQLTSKGGWSYKCGGTIPLISSTEHTCFAGGSQKDKTELGKTDSPLLSSVVRVACVSIRRNEALGTSQGPLAEKPADMKCRQHRPFVVGQFHHPP